MPVMTGSLPSAALRMPGCTTEGMRSLIASLLVSLLLRAAPAASSPADLPVSPRALFPVSGVGPAPIDRPAPPAPSFPHVLGSYETRYNTQRRSRDRVNNVELAARHLDGTVIAPGEVLSFDAVVGPRTRAAGFRDAPVLAGGEHHLGMGGGVCQVASTLHAAALYAGLAIVQQHVHSLPSTYIDPGLDARIADGTSNLEVRNTTAAPVLVRARAVRGVVHVELLGSTTPAQVTISSEIEAVPAGEQLVIDSTLAPGVRIVDDAGHDGLRVLRTRTIDGRTERRAFLYPAVDAAIRIGA